MTYQLRHIAPNGVQTPLPDWSSLSFSALFSDVGTLGFDYAVDGVNAHLVKDQAEVAVFDDEGEVPDTRAIVEALNTETFVVEGRTYFEVQCRTLWKFLAEGAVYNDGWPNNPGNRVYTGATPGDVLHGTMARAGAAGEIQGLTWTFTKDVDSYGQPWGSTVSLEIPLGTPILQFVQDMVDRGLVEVRIQGRTIIAAKPGTLGRDLTTSASPTVLWAGQGATAAPEQTSSVEIRTVAIVKGDANVFEEVTDATAVAKYGRRPIFVNASGVTDRGTLRAIGTATLGQKNEVRRERTFEYPIRPGLPVPMRGLLPGDWVLTDATSTAAPLERVRVMQVSITADSTDSDGVATLTLNDLFLDREIRLARQLAGITGGADGAGGIPSGADEEDLLGPAQVIGLAVSSSAYADRVGANFAQLTAVWSAVTTNSDGSSFDDFDHYDVQWRYTTAPADEWSLNMQTTQVRLSWSPVLTGRNVNIRVRAVDRNGNPGDWSETKTVYTAVDTTPPPKPSKPVLVPFLGGARATWDGKGSAGEAMPGDFSHVEVHLSTSATFTPSASTLYMTTPVGGVVPLVDLSYDSPTFVRFVAVDLSSPPNKSDPSDASSVQAERLVEADVANAAVTAQKLADGAATLAKIAPGAIDATKITDDAVQTKHIAAGAVTASEMLAGTITAASGILGDLAVTNAKLANAAVNNAKIADATIQDAKIANLSVGKLTAGYLSADVTIGARLATSLSGARVELNSNGLQAWNSSGTRTVNITTGGDADIMGTFRSGARNGRRLIISAMLSEAGAGGANQAGMVFNSNNWNLRDAQIYDTGNYMRLDSPAFDATPSGQGTTMDIGRDAITGYVRGGAAAFRITNDNSVRLSGSDGGFEKYTAGTWHAGHFNDQAIFSTGTELRIRGRSSGGSVGVYVASGSWFDVWGNGYVHGAFGADSKQFVITHPTKADHKLVHGCTESPVAGVEYWGNVTLGENGQAVIDLPDYFEALTKTENRSVQVTPIGTIFPVATSDLVNGRFTVYGLPGKKVNWLVKAERMGADFEVEPLCSVYESTVSPTSSAPTPVDADIPVTAVPEEENNA